MSEVASFYSPRDSPIETDDENENENDENYPRTTTTARTEQIKDLLNLSLGSQVREYEPIATKLVTDVLSIYNNTKGWTQSKELKTDQFEAFVYTKKFAKIGKVFKLETVIPYNDKLLVHTITNNIDDYLKWNTTVQSIKIIKKFTDTLAILHTCVYEQVGGLVSPRDFCNLTKYAFIGDKHIMVASACVDKEVPPQEGYVR
jgi:hypothetical protein